MTYQEAFAVWSEHIKPAVVAQYGDSDTTALSESWNDYTDELAKDHEMTATEYHYCPAHDDDMPDDQLEFVIEAMGVQVTTYSVNDRPDGVDFGGSNYLVVVQRRSSMAFPVYYSMGAAHDSGPSVCDVLHSMIADTDGIEDSFEDWADVSGYDTDSRKAESLFAAIKVEAANLSSMFTTQELDDLRELFRDY